MSTAAAIGAEPSTGAARVIGTFVTLALFLGALVWLGQQLFVAPVDGAAKQREYFGENPPPFGLVLESALRLPTNQLSSWSDLRSYSSATRIGARPSKTLPARCGRAPRSMSMAAA